jgi:Flp pilus assembly pilin Flp
MIVQRSFYRYVRDEDGTVLVEFLIILPLLIWAMIAIFVYWDVFRTQNTAQKAAYSLADVISRQKDSLSPSFVDGMQGLFEFLMLSNSREGKIRITSLIFDNGEDPAETATGDDKYELLFSVSPMDNLPELTEDDLQDLKGKIPRMSDRDSVVIVETNVKFSPAFDVGLGGLLAQRFTGLGGQEFTEFIVTRPRFKPRICLDDGLCPNL